MKGYVTNIERDTLENNYFRRVLYSAKNTQLVLMSLRPKEDIGEEIHTLDQSSESKLEMALRFSTA